ncbi:hypothetical protein ACFPM0_21205 [Pseudonocardia sulfidoxydans]|uniref:hypothetical protein n=1 Tax=Pseudonocardia sulfidoxydans TaxID=54011 RepID=UPI0036199F30
MWSSEVKVPGCEVRLAYLRDATVRDRCPQSGLHDTRYGFSDAVSRGTRPASSP